MVIANTLILQSSDVEILKENDDHLALYSHVSVPRREMERILSILHMRGRTNLETLIDQLARNEYDFYLQRRYVYALMHAGKIEFDMFTPIDETTDVWSLGIECI